MSIYKVIWIWILICYNILTSICDNQIKKSTIIFSFSVQAWKWQSSSSFPKLWRTLYTCSFQLWTFRLILQLMWVSHPSLIWGYAGSETLYLRRVLSFSGAISHWIHPSLAPFHHRSQLIWLGSLWDLHNSSLLWMSIFRTWYRQIFNYAFFIFFSLVGNSIPIPFYFDLISDSYYLQHLLSFFERSWTLDFVWIYEGQNRTRFSCWRHQEACLFLWI